MKKLWNWLVNLVWGKPQNITKSKKTYQANVFNSNERVSGDFIVRDHGLRDWEAGIYLYGLDKKWYRIDPKTIIEL